MNLGVTYTSTSVSEELDSAFEAAVKRVRGDAKARHRLLIGGRQVDGGGGVILQRNPAHTDEQLGAFPIAGRAEVAEAVEAARTAFPGWRRTPWAARIEVLLNVAELLARDAAELAAVLSLEVGKNRVEALGEVDECVALIAEYTRQMEEGDGYRRALGSTTGHERNLSVMRPYGVFGIIAPFNFPLALVVGPAAAALVTGNTVVAKPSPTTSWATSRLADLFTEAGVPPGVFNLVTGDDETGRALAEHPALDGLVFTGSYEVGQSIVRAFTTTRGYVRPCIAEMGGKNTAFVTDSADVDAAVAGIARSAFGLSGQKCSACSRVVVDEAVHDALLARLAEERRRWTVADPTLAACRLGPVHTEEALRRYAAATATAQEVGAVVTGGTRPNDPLLGDGWFVEPTVISSLPAGHSLTREEQFLPIVTVEAFTDLREAIARVNREVYGLTAGIFSNREDEIERFLDEIETGTLYVNRAAGATTGGWPGATTFAGWKGSGSTGRGALGPHYVPQFLREQNRTTVIGVS